MPHARSGDARIHYDVQGDGEPLLLLMGYGLSADAWAPIIPMLSGYRIITVDNRGTGGSDPPGESFGVATMSADAVAVLDDCAVQRAHVHGLSMGGMIAQQLVLDHPERVGALALGCTSPAPVRFIGDPMAAVSLFQGTVLAATDPEAGLDLLLPLVFSEGFLAATPSVRDLARQTMSQAALSPGAAEAMMRALGDMTTGHAWDVSDRLGEITAPTLVQHGSADRLVPVEAGRYIAAHVPGAEYQELEGAGHIYGIEQPMESFPRLLAFLAAHRLS